jgi:hypothetical protein
MCGVAHWSASFEANKLTQKLSPCLRECAEFGALSRIYTEEPRREREEEKSCYALCVRTTLLLKRTCIVIFISLSPAARALLRDPNRVIARRRINFS